MSGRSVRAVALIALVLTALTGCGFEIVDTGHRGVQTRFGEVYKDSLPEGFHTYNPFTEDITEVNVQLQRWDFKTICYTQDLQEATLDATATYSLIPSAAPITFQTIGKDWAEKVVGQDIFDRIKGVCGIYTADKLISQRTKAVSEMTASVAAALKANNVMLTGLAITNIKFSDEYDTAVEAKAVAEQQAQAEKNRTSRIRELALQRTIDADADALAMRSRAAAIRENQALLQWEALQVERERIKQWKGGVPLYQFGGNSSGGVPLIQLPAPPQASDKVER